ncbi:MAG: carboxypeptidase-like regulatory domain-containing protein [Paludibacter sp.]|nr:carboxypeptidase-like regulatory domain-containing protein [Paludibacter sp.]
MKNYKYIITVILLFLIASCETEKIEIVKYGSISGKVVDSETYSPIVGAMITTTPPSSSILSDSEGYFTLPKIEEGEVAVIVKMNKYLTNTFDVSVTEKETTALELLLFKEDESVGNISIYDPVPGNGAVDQLYAITMKWGIDGKKSGITLTYNVFIFESNSTVQKLLGENVALQEVTTSDLKPSTTYFWYVVAKYNETKVATSPTWSFKTKAD